MSAAITAVGLSKRYAMPSAPGRVLNALTDVSFQIQEGEAVGLIGRNGAGKSTLLRILSRVTRPTAGYADVAGTVGALLEVGTGFHPDLTGRENAYLSGAILGLSKAEVRARFDEIVDFAEIASFIDEPVKHYSSGMFARLGFAVAAHLRPSILIVDEVLAVGDTAFQAKCLARMHGLTAVGTTVLFVSHNLLAVSDLCTRALIMVDGVLVLDGTTEDAIVRYRQLLADVTTPTQRAAPALAMTINGLVNPMAATCNPNEPLRIEVVIDRPGAAPETAVVLNVLLESSDGRVVMHLRSDKDGEDLRLSPGSSRFGIDVDSLPLAPASYWLSSRVVALDPADPILLDSTRVELTVRGEQTRDAIVLPRHRFRDLSVRNRAPSLAGKP